MKKDETRFIHRHKFLLQSVALLLMVVVPVLLYQAAQAGGVEWILALLGLIAGAMALSIWVS